MGRNISSQMILYLTLYYFVSFFLSSLLLFYFYLSFCFFLDKIKISSSFHSRQKSISPISFLFFFTFSFLAFFKTTNNLIETKQLRTFRTERKEKHICFTTVKLIKYFFPSLKKYQEKTI